MCRTRVRTGRRCGGCGGSALTSFDFDFGPPLASLDFLGDRDELQRRAMETVAAMPPGWRPPSHYIGSEPSASVRVTVSGDGEVLDVEVAPHWAQRLRPGALPRALYLAYITGQAKAAETVALGNLLREEAMTDAERQRRADEQAAAVAAGFSATRSISDELASLSEMLERIERQAGIAAGGAVRQVSSPRGYLTFDCVGNTISDITGDAQLIASADPRTLRSEALGGFRAVSQTEGGDGERD